MTEATPAPWSRVKRLMVFASGADASKLRHVPSDVGNYVTLGAGVFLTALIAFISGLAALANSESDVAFKQWHLLGATVWSLIVFLIDWLLLRWPLNPITFEGKFGRDGSRIEYDRVEGLQLVARRVRQGIGRVVMFLTAVALRLMIAGLIAWFVAELLILLLFRDAVAQELDDYRQVRLEQLQAAEDARHSKALESLKRPVPDLDRNGVNDVADRETKIKALESQIRELVRKRACEVQLITAETKGTGFRCGSVPATREKKCKSACQAAILRARQYRSQIRVARQEVSALKGEIRSIDAGRIRYAGYNQRLKEAESAHRNQAAANEKAAAVAGGLERRLEILEKLTTDEDPFKAGQSNEPGASKVASVEAQDAAVEMSPYTACGDDLFVVRPFCYTAKWFGRLTVIGQRVWMLRAILFLFDTLPIIGKVFMSLRKRRPYDEFVAALEEHDRSGALRMASRQFAARRLEFRRLAVERERQQVEDIVEAGPSQSLVERLLKRARLRSNEAKAGDETSPTAEQAITGADPFVITTLKDIDPE